MTLRELVTTTHTLGEIDIEIRDKKGILIDSIQIGSRVTEDRIGGHEQEPRWKCIRKPVNLKETGKDYWGTIITAIPKKYLDSEVTFWQLWKGFSLNNGLWQFYELHVVILGVDKYIETTVTEEPEQLQGQMSIEDFITG